MRKLFILLLLLCSSIFANEIEVRIIYGDGTPAKKVTASYEEGTTALELLKRVSNVKTYQKG